MPSTNVKQWPHKERRSIHVAYPCPHCGAHCQRIVVSHRVLRLACLACSQPADIYVEVDAAYGPPRNEGHSLVMAEFRHALENDDD